MLSKLIYLQSLSGAFQAFALKGVVRAQHKKVFHLTTNAAATARKIYCKENSQRRDLYPNASFTFLYCKTLPFIFKLSKRVVALFYFFIRRSVKLSQKNIGSTSVMLTGKFLQIRKVFFQIQNSFANPENIQIL